MCARKLHSVIIHHMIYASIASVFLSLSLCSLCLSSNCLLGSPQEALTINGAVERIAKRARGGQKGNEQTPDANGYDIINSKTLQNGRN